MNSQDTNPSEKNRKNILLLLLFLSLSCFLIFSVCTQVAALAVACVFAYLLCLLYMTRSRAMLVFSALLGLAALLLSGSLTGAAYVLSCVGVFALGAYSIYAFLPAVWLCLPVSFGICCAITGDAIASLGMLWLLPGTVLLGLALRYRRKRSAATAALTLGIFVGVVGWLMVSLKLSGSSLSFASFSSFVGEFRDELIAAIMQSLDTLPTEVTSSWNQVINEEYLTQLINVIIWYLPAGITVAAEVVAYLAGFFALRAVAIHPLSGELPAESRLWKFNPATAVVFGITFLLMLLAGGSTDTGKIISIACGNVNVILLPCMALGGLIRLLVKWRRGAGNASPLRIIFIVIGAVFFFTYIPYFLAFIEVFALIREMIASLRENSPRDM